MLGRVLFLASAVIAHGFVSTSWKVVHQVFAPWASDGVVELPYRASKILVSDHYYVDNALLGNEIPLYVDSDLVVIDKPFYSRTVPSQHVKACVACNVMQALDLDRVDQMIVHRLDYATSGIVLLARNVDALKSLHGQFRHAGHVRKIYHALVHGKLPANEGVIDLPLGKDLDKGSPFCKVDLSPSGKSSVTEWRCLQQAADVALVELTPKTGR
eukprot:gene36805-44648_t